MEKNLYYIEETELSKPDFVIAYSIQNAIHLWKEFVKNRDEISGRSTDAEEPELIKLVTENVIGV